MGSITLKNAANQCASVMLWECLVRGRPPSARWADPSRAVRAHRAPTCPAGPVPSRAAARGELPTAHAQAHWHGSPG
eukprot:8533025-Alexandrium_andersonii.AAC.1